MGIKRQQQSVRVRTSKTQDEQLHALSMLVRLGFNFAYDNRKKLWDEQGVIQSNRELEARLREVPQLAAQISKRQTLTEIIKTDKGLRFAHQTVMVGVERCRDSFTRYSRSSSTKARKPRRKSTLECPSIQFAASQVELGVGYVVVPVVGRLNSRIKTHNFSGDYPAKNVVIKRIADGEWNVSVGYNSPKSQLTQKGVGVIGIDINCSNTLGLWVIYPNGGEDGFVIDLPDTTKADRDITHYKEKLEHAAYGSNRRREVQEHLDTASRHRQNIIKEHHIYLVRLILSFTPEVIVFEDMDLRDEGYHGWKKVAVNQLRRSLIDRGRAEDNGARVTTVNRAYTTMTCSDCGHVQEMPSEVREYVCPECGMVRDRDLNSARNIARKYLNSVQPSMVGTTRR